MNNAMIYVHIPFCDSKCYYCDFCSAKYDLETQEKYFKKLNQEIQFNSNKNILVSSIYIGGGTPSSVDEKYICEILYNIKKHYNISKNAEISIEANPCSITENKLLAYKNAGINRVSFGVQSLNNKCLKLIGRKHTKKQAISAIYLAKKHFNNINADVLIGIPNQNYFILKNTIKNLIKLKIPHVSCYMLINEKGTKLTNLIEEKKVKVAGEDKCVDFYNKIVSFLKKNKYNRYEISNFSKSNFECKHNLGYWDITPYFGFGLSAHSFIDNTRYSNTTSMQQYLDYNFDYNKEKLASAEIIEEYIMLSLRTSKGINLAKLKNLGYDILKQKANELKILKDNKMIDISKTQIKISENSFGVANQIILMLIP